MAYLNNCVIFIKKRKRKMVATHLPMAYLNNKKEKKNECKV